MIFINYLTIFKNMQLFSQKYPIIFKKYAVILKNMQLLCTYAN